MSKDKERQDGSDDFAGIGRTGAAFLVTVAALTHPRQTLKEVFPMVRRLGVKALKLALAPFMLVRLMLWSRRDRGPTFEDYLHGGMRERDTRR